MGHILRAGGQQVIDLSLGEPIHKRDGHISEEQQALAGIGVGDVGELVLGNAQLLGEDRPVTLGLRQQDQKIRVVQNVGDGRACQQVFHILREGAGDAALFAEHLPHGHKVAGGEFVPQQDFFNYNRINMALSSNTKFDEHLRSLFGEARTAKLKYELENRPPEQREPIVLNALIDALRENRSNYVLPFKFYGAEKLRTSHFIIFSMSRRTTWANSFC